MTEEGETISPNVTSESTSRDKPKKTTHKSQRKHKPEEGGEKDKETTTNDAVAPEASSEGAKKDKDDVEVDAKAGTSKGKTGSSSSSKRKSKTSKEKSKADIHKVQHLSMDPDKLSQIKDINLITAESTANDSEEDKKKHKKKHESNGTKTSSRKDKKKKDNDEDTKKQKKHHSTSKHSKHTHSSSTSHNHRKSATKDKKSSKSTISSHSSSVRSKSSSSASSSSSSSSSSSPPGSSNALTESKSSSSSPNGSKSASSTGSTEEPKSTSKADKVSTKGISGSIAASVNIDTSLIEMIDRPDAASAPSATSDQSNLLCSADAEEADEIVSGTWAKSAVIGVGFQGTTYTGTWIKNRRPVAIKAFRSMQLSSSHLQQLERIAPLLEGIDHSCVVHYYGICVEDKRLHSVSELVNGSSLANIVREYGPFPEDLVAACIGQALYGLAYLHAKGVPHGAVHANNLIMNFATGECKLSDICLKILAEQRPLARSSGNDSGSNAASSGDSCYATNGAYSVYGRPNWLPPEVVEMESSASPMMADVWSIGCTCVELLTGAPPYAEHKHPIAVLNAILTAKEAPIPDAVSEDLREFLEACFVRDPAKRPTPASLKSHPFITKLAGSTLADCISRAGKFISRHCDTQPNDISAAGRRAEDFEMSTIAVTVTESEEAEALSSANECLTQFKAQIQMLEEKMKQRVDTINSETNNITTNGNDNTTVINNNNNNINNNNNDNNNNNNDNNNVNGNSAFEKLGKEVLPVLKRCARLQDFLMTFAMGMRSKYINACRDEARTNQLNSLCEADKDKAEREYEVAIGAVQAITENTLRLEDRLLSSKETKDGIYGLAKMLYGKLASDSLGGSYAGLLEIMGSGNDGNRGENGGNIADGSSISTLSSDAGVSDTKWKPSWVVLRDNFIFFFKSGAVNSPTGIIHLPKLRALHIGLTNGRSFCFTVANSGVLFSASSFDIANEWVLAINRSTTWFEYGEYTLDEQCYKEPIFGVTPRDLALRDPTRGDPNLPSFFNVLVEHVIRNGLRTEGILRVPGSVTSIEALKSAFEVTPRAVDVDLSREDIHCVVGLLKGWLRQLPDFLTVEETKAFVTFMAAHPKPGPMEAPALRRLVGRHIQPSVAAVIRKLCELILRIAANEAQNKMSLDNALICVISSLAIQPAIFTYLVTNYTLIFGPLKKL